MTVPLKQGSMQKDQSNKMGKATISSFLSEKYFPKIEIFQRNH